MKATSLKDWKRVYQRIKHVRGLDEHEKILYARSLAATPDERWQMNETHLRSYGLWGRSALKTFCKSKAAVMREKDTAPIHYIDETLRLRGKARGHQVRGGKP
jgi:hypothetical protein